MAVITKYVVVRNGAELDEVFLVKKEADAYDKMLDAAEDLAAFISDAGLEIDLDRKVVDAIAVFLAKNGPEVSRILKGIKPVAPSVRNPDDPKRGNQDLQAASKKRTMPAKATPKGK